LEKKIMRRKDGAFNVTELLQLGARENETCGGSMRSSKAERARDLYWQSKALEKSLDVKIKQGELIDRKTVVQELVDRELVFKGRLLGLADILASRLVGLGAVEIRAVCTENFMSLLKELARKGSEVYKNAHTG
jgi:hypothetical protein